MHGRARLGEARAARQDLLGESVLGLARFGEVW